MLTMLKPISWLQRQGSAAWPCVCLHHLTLTQVSETPPPIPVWRSGFTAHVSSVGLGPPLFSLSLYVCVTVYWGWLPYCIYSASLVCVLFVCLYIFLLCVILGQNRDKAYSKCSVHSQRELMLDLRGYSPHLQQANFHTSCKMPTRHWSVNILCVYAVFMLFCYLFFIPTLCLCKFHVGGKCSSCGADPPWV